jgi:hypothetical protein
VCFAALLQNVHALTLGARNFATRKKIIPMANDISLPPERLFALLDRMVTVRIDIALDLATLDIEQLRERLRRTAAQVDIAIADLKDMLAVTRTDAADPEFKLGKPNRGTKLQ